MKKMALSFPEYYWNTNMGYPTKKHREAISKYGVSPIHRLTFQLLPEQLKLNIE
jgi:ribonuclease HII